MVAPAPWWPRSPQIRAASNTFPCPPTTLRLFQVISRRHQRRSHHPHRQPRMWHPGGALNHPPPARHEDPPFRVGHATNSNIPTPPKWGNTSLPNPVRFTVAGNSRPDREAKSICQGTHRGLLRPPSEAGIATRINAANPTGLPVDQRSCATRKRAGIERRRPPARRGMGRAGLVGRTSRRGAGQKARSPAPVAGVGNRNGSHPPFRR